MKRYPIVFLLALCALVLNSCSERDASLVDVGRGTSLAFVPRFVLLGGSQSTADINAIRLTARSVPSNAVVATSDTTVDPTDVEWDLRLSIPPDAGTVIVLIELISRGPGGETIEWSGETAPIEVRAGVTNTPASVQLFQGPPINLRVTSVTIVPDGVTLAEGTTRALAATVAPAGFVFWSSLDPAVATVDASGTVHAHRNGTARIVAAAGPRADTIVVTATAVVASIALSPDTLLITALGGQGGFLVSARDARGGEVAGAAITWTVANATVATHIGNGQLRAVANGVTQVTATSATNPAIFANATLLVSQRGGNITLAPASASIASIGGTQQFTATVTDPVGNAMPTPQIQWRSSNAAVATVDANGLATALSAGSTEIIAVVNAGAPDSVVARASLLVSQTAASIDVQPTDTTLTSVRDTVLLRAKVLDASGNVVPNVDITWSSSNAAIATVDDNGVVTALSNGTATIIAAAGGARGTVSITVAQMAVSASITPANDTVGVAATTQMVATARDANEFAIANAAFTWTSSDTMVAVVSATGLVTGRQAGTAVITAQSGSATATAAIVVEGSTELPNLSVLSLTTDPVNPLVEAQPVTISLQVKNTGGTATPEVAVLLTVLDAAAPHTDVGGVLTVLPALAAGQEMTFSQTVVLVGAAEYPDSVWLVGTVDPSNALAESSEDDNTIQTETKVIQFVQHTWTGALNNQWDNPANWMPLNVPHSRSPVLIPSGLSIYPVLTGDAEIASLTQHAGSLLTLSEEGVMLTVHGSVEGANIVGGTVRLTGTGGVLPGQSALISMPTANGTVGGLMVAGPVQLTGYFQTNGHTEIEQNGAVYVAANEFRVESSLTVHGILDMTNPAASVVVYENAAFTGGASSVGHLTAGTLRLLRYLDLAGANAFAASGTHLTIFASAIASTVTVAGDPGIHFQNVRSEGSGSQLSLVGDAFVNGDFERVAGTQQVIGDHSITIGGNLISLGGWAVRTTIFTGSPQIPLLIDQHVEFTGDAVLAPTQTYHIGGNVTVRDGGNLDLGNAVLNVGGDFTTETGGTLEMRNNDDLVILGNAHFNGGNTDGKLNSGRIDVHGNFFAGAPGAFAACGDCDGPLTLWMVGTERTTIEMLNSGVASNANHFGELYIGNTGGVQVLSDIAIAGELDFGSVLEVPTELTDEEGFFTVTLGGDLDDDDGYGRNFRVSNLILLSSNSSLPEEDPNTDRVELFTNLTFAGTGVAFPENRMHVHGNIIVKNGELNLVGADLEADGSFLTIEGGSLRMPGCDCTSPRLRVHGDVTFSGANNTDPTMLEAGTIYVGGNFTAAANSFNASMFHVTKMFDYEGNGETRTITLTNPGLGSGMQHFGTLRIRRSTDLLTDIAVAGHIEVDGGQPLTGLGRTATVVGDIEDTSFGCSECTLSGAGATGSDTLEAKPLAIGARRPAVQTATTAAPVVRKAGEKPVAPLNPRLNASLAASVSPLGMYNVSNTVLAGGVQYLPEFINTNVTVISDVLLESGFTMVSGDVIVTGPGAQLRLGDVDEFSCFSIYLGVGQDFETRNGGTLQIECNDYLDVEGNAVFDGGSLSGKLLHGTIDVAGDFTATDSNPHSFVSEGVSLSLTADAATNPVQTVFLATPLTQTFSDVWVNHIGAVNLDLPNGANVYGWFNEFHENEDILITGNGVLHVRAIDTCNDACWYGGFQVYNARIDNLRVITEHTELYIQYIVFGTYPTNVDQITINDVQQSPYVGEISFLTPPADGFYHMRASDGGSEIVVNNPTPATEADGARWTAENGASIVWGPASNLVVQSVTHPSAVSVGQTVSLSTMVRNDGETAIGPFQVAVRVLDGDGNPVAGVPPITFDVTPGLPASATLLKTLSVVISPLITWPPVIQAEIILDSTNAITESNERDNTKLTGPVTISPAS